MVPPSETRSNQFNPGKSRSINPIAPAPCPTDLKSPRRRRAKRRPLVQSRRFDLRIDQFGSCRNAITSSLDRIANVDDG
jgi:hypothetical protein